MKDKKHYAWKVMLACILIKIGTAGMTMVAMGNFVTPIVKELNCGVSALTAYSSVNAVAMALLYTTAVKFLNTKNIGKIMGIASLIEAVGLGLMSTYDNVFLFYLSGAAIGFAQAFTGYVAIPAVINMWFKKNTGTVLGTVMAVGSAATTLYSLLTGQLINFFGWRQSYVIMALIAAVVTVPAVFLFIKRPEEAGCLPYGAEEAGQISAAAVSVSDDGYSLTKKQAMRLPMFYIAWVACVCFSYGSGVAYNVQTFSTMELGQTITFSSVVGVSLSLGTIFSSLIVGWINDKFGVNAGLGWGFATTAVGFMMMFLSYSNPVFVLPAVFIVGLGNTMYTVQCPLLARTVVGDQHYSEIWAVMMVINSMVGGGLCFTIGLFYDLAGTFQGAFIMGIGLFAAGAILGNIAIQMSNKLRKKLASAS